jgi:hypothetical protein
MKKLTHGWWRRKQPDPKMLTAIFTFLAALLDVVKEVIAAIVRK